MWNFARLSPLPPLSSSRRRRRRRRRLLLSVSSSDQICVRSFFSPGHLLAWYSGRTDSSRSGQTAMCKPCRVGTGWAYIAHGAKVWTENSTVTRVNLGTAHLCKRCCCCTSLSWFVHPTANPWIHCMPQLPCEDLLNLSFANQLYTARHIL